MTPAHSTAGEIQLIVFSTLNSKPGVSELFCTGQETKNFVLVTHFSSVQSLSRVRLFGTPWTAARQASLSITSSWSLFKLMSIESVMPSTISSCVAASPSAVSLSQHQGLSSESALRIRWPKYWNFSFNISPSNEHSGLISFRMDWLDLLTVQGTVKSLLQHHSSKASILQCSAFFTIQLSHPYMPLEKP